MRHAKQFIARLGFRIGAGALLLAPWISALADMTKT
jgi:hypothetical protein